MSMARRGLAAFCWLLFFLISLPALSLAHGVHDEDGEIDKPEALKWKIAGIILILVTSTVGILIPVLGKRWPILRPERDFFFVLKAFAAGVILATAMIHILPEAFEKLADEGLDLAPWKDFPFAGFVAMVSALLTLIIDATASGYFYRSQVQKSQPIETISKDEETASNPHVHSHGPAISVGSSAGENSKSELIRHRIISQVLEIGIVIHSVIVGISVGTSLQPSSLRPLVAALCFHQFFEGIGLGGCIVQGRFKAVSVVLMVIFFVTTMPAGIGIGIGIMSQYDADSTTALAVEGVLNAAAAGILIYMSLVDLLAADFLSHRMQQSGRLQLFSYASLLLGAAAMSIVGKWA